MIQKSTAHIWRINVKELKFIFLFLNLSNNSTISYSTNSFVYEFDASIGPKIDSVTPTIASNGTLTISGSGFGTDPSKVSVKIGSKSCSVKTLNDGQLTCELIASSAGVFPVVVNINNIGNSNSDQVFTYNLVLTSLSSSQGSIGGNLKLTINGEGFSKNSNVTICNNQCKLIESSIASLACLVPPASNKIADTACTLVVNENGLSVSDTFTYSLALTPKLISVTPSRCGTGGGTLLTITGTNFPLVFTNIWEIK